MFMWLLVFEKTGVQCDRNDKILSLSRMTGMLNVIFAKS